MSSVKLLEPDADVISSCMRDENFFEIYEIQVFRFCGAIIIIFLSIWYSLKLRKYK